MILVDNDKLRKKILQSLHNDFKKSSHKYVKGESITKSVKCNISELKSNLRYLEGRNFVEVIWPTGSLPIARITSDGIDFVENKKGFGKNMQSTHNIQAENVQISYGDNSPIIRGDNNVINQNQDLINSLKFLHEEILKLNLREKTEKRLTRTITNIEDEARDNKPNLELIAKDLREIKEKLESSGKPFDKEKGWGKTLSEAAHVVKKIAPAVVPILAALL